MSGIGDPFEQGMWDDSAAVSADEVLRAWLQLAERESPWCSMRLDDRTGELRAVLTELLNALDGSECPARRLRLHRAAISHGLFRGNQRCKLVTVETDFVLLRKAVQQAFRNAGASRLLTREVVRALLPDWKVARSAARIALADIRGI